MRTGCGWAEHRRGPRARVQGLKPRRVSEGGNAAQRAGVVHAQPAIHAMRMVYMATLWQLPHALPPAKVLQAYGAGGRLQQQDTGIVTPQLQLPLSALLSAFYAVLQASTFLAPAYRMRT